MGRFDYVRDDVARRIRVRVLEPLPADDLLAIVDRQIAEGAWAFGLVYDLRALTGTHAASPADARLATERSLEYQRQHGPRGPVAVVTRDVKMIGLGQAHAHEAARRGVEVQVFWDLAEAEHWLTSWSPRPAGPGTSTPAP